VSCPCRARGPALRHGGTLCGPDRQPAASNRKSESCPNCMVLSLNYPQLPWELATAGGDRFCSRRRMVFSFVCRPLPSAVGWAAFFDPRV